MAPKTFRRRRDKVRRAKDKIKSSSEVPRTRAAPAPLDLAQLDAEAVNALTARQRRTLGIARPRGRPPKAANEARLLQIKAAVTSDEKIAVLDYARALGHVNDDGEPLEGKLIRALVIEPALRQRSR